ncbi:MAG: PCMD domain-containing protein [Rikenellaceae bacterium]
MKRFFLKYLSYMVVLFGTLFLASCIKNDIPYPVIELEITNVSGVGFTQKSINTNSGVVVIELDETTNIREVEISSVSYTIGAESSQNLVGTFDMRSPISTTLSLYQSYDWEIQAEQVITREFKVVGQIGEERIDTTQKIVEVDVNEATVDITDVDVLSMKLAASGITTYSPTLEELTHTNFSTVRRVFVTSHNIVETWNIYVNPIEASVTLAVDAWGTVAWLSAMGDTTDPDDCRFGYRMSGYDEWIEVAASSVGNGVFSAQVTGLLPSSDYEFQAYVGDDTSAEVLCTTESTPQLPNSDFEGWQQIGNAWYPYAVDEEEYWGTGNKGSTLLSSSSNITLPDSETAPGSTGIKSALLSSESVLNIFAAGNIFTGRFVKIAGTNGIIGFGRPFTERPLALRGWAKYTQGTITHSKHDSVAVGDLDQGSIYIALGTWDAETYGLDSTGEILGDSTTPIIVDTRDKNTFFDTTSKDIIAYGELIISSDMDWSEFEIELEYRDLTDSSGNIIESAYSRVPTHIVVVCSSSRYGDYFTGSTKSDLLIDDFELLYE